MKRIAIIGAGISGLTAAYELEKARIHGADIDWHLYEASNRLGGTIQTTQQEDFILEGGPDAWVTEKPWATQLAIELGLEADLIYSNDATRKTYILINNKLQPIPDRMRMMVPEDLATLENSALFSASAKKAYADELANAAELRASAPTEDESIATFVQRHFGEEVLTKIAAPLLSGVFGGDVHKLSVRAVMPAFVAMEREHGSLIAALQSRPKREPKPIFTSLRTGVQSITDALTARLPPERIHLNQPAFSIKREGKLWCLRTTPISDRAKPGKSKRHVNHILLATPSNTTRTLLSPLSPTAASLIPANSSSAILASFAWPADTPITLPQGFGFLVPQSDAIDPQLLAATFATQKFPHRSPTGATIIRAFFGGPSAQALATASDATILQTAQTQLENILGPLATSSITTVRHVPHSLPQYEVGHQTRITELHALINPKDGLTLLGNAYTGVGLPDLIRDAKAATSALIASLTKA